MDIINIPLIEVTNQYDVCIVIENRTVQPAATNLKSYEYYVEVSWAEAMTKTAVCCLTNSGTTQAMLGTTQARRSPDKCELAPFFR